nr:MAG: coat protein [brine shrimp partitivirus 2]UNI73940.1 MAG: coat protein [brine shrimp partitivirus 2]
MSTRKQVSKAGRSKGRPRDYDLESGMDRVRKPSTKKVTQVVESEEDFTSDEDSAIATAKKKILHKDYKEDARRQRFRQPSPPSSDNEDENLGTALTTKQTGTAAKTAAKSANTEVAPYLVLYNIMDKHGETIPVHHTLNTFTVNFHVLFELHNALQVSTVRNSKLRKHYGDFFALGTRIYYAYLGYYQILRATIAANVSLSAVERRTFRKLESTLPLESCPVAGPMVPWFQALGSYKPEDKTYNWVYPVVQDFTAGHTLFTYANNAYFYPNIPLMVALFDSISRIPSRFRTYHNQADRIIPIQNANNATVAWLGENWTLDNATPSDNGILDNFGRPGLSFPLPEHISYLNSERVSEWKRIGVPHVVQTTPTHDLEHFLLCSGDNQLNWLRTFRNWANAEAKFARGSANLSQISPTCGPHVTSLVEYEDPPNRPQAFTEPWLADSNNYHRNLGFFTKAFSASVDRSSIQNNHIFRIVIEPAGVGNRLPAALANMTGTVTGPVYRKAVPNGQYTGEFLDRWKRVIHPETDDDADLADIVNVSLYSPLGEEPTSVRLQN